jgi:hypothetical protein
VGQYQEEVPLLHSIKSRLNNFLAPYASSKGTGEVFSLN